MERRTFERTKRDQDDGLGTKRHSVETHHTASESQPPPFTPPPPPPPTTPSSRYLFCNAQRRRFGSAATTLILLLHTHQTHSDGFGRRSTVHQAACQLCPDARAGARQRLTDATKTERTTRVSAGDVNITDIFTNASDCYYTFILDAAPTLQSELEATKTFTHTASPLLSAFPL